MSFGKKTRNPGWQSGNHWVKCDVCDFVYRDSEMFERWDGAVVCKYDWESRHPQDLIRGVEDRITPDGFIRPDDLPNIVDGSPAQSLPCISRTARAGQAKAGCARSGDTSLSPTPVSGL